VAVALVDDAEAEWVTVALHDGDDAETSSRLRSPKADAVDDDDETAVPLESRTERVKEIQAAAVCGRRRWSHRAAVSLVFVVLALARHLRQTTARAQSHLD
jgi:hypothetical protein